MRTIRTIALAALLCIACSVVIWPVGCSGDTKEDKGVGGGSISEVVTATEGAESAARMEDAMRGPDKPYWELDSRAALDELFQNADGHAAYYIFDPIPAGLVLGRASLDEEGTGCVMRFDGEDEHYVLLFVFAPEDPDGDRSRFTEIDVDGTTYYYYHNFDEHGECYVSYFEWEEDGKIMLVHPGEEITPEVIRKYGVLDKVEYNIGQTEVGLGTGKPLVADPSKKKDLVRGNKGIHYHTGTLAPGKTDDLLEP